MVQKFKIPWAAWYGDKDIQLEFPDTWDVNIYKMQDTTELSQEDIKNAFSNPIGTSTIQEIAKGKSNAVIAVEDISRPIQAESILLLMASVSGFLPAKSAIPGASSVLKTNGISRA